MDTALDTLYVTKSQLYPIDLVEPNWDQYRRCLYGLMRAGAEACRTPTRALCIPTTPRINMEVTWIGNEDLAIRSIALRDSIGQLVLGTSQVDSADSAASANLFAAAIRDARIGLSWMRAIRSPFDGASSRARLTSNPTRHTAAFNVLDETDCRQCSGVRSDPWRYHRHSVWNEVNSNKQLFQRWKTTANPNMQVPDAVVSKSGWARSHGSARNYKLSKCSFQHCRAQRWSFSHPPAGSACRLYRARLRIGAGNCSASASTYRTWSIMLPTLPALARLGAPPSRARSAAQTDHCPFCVGAVYINFDWVPISRNGIHTPWMHFPEPSEMRTILMNLGLCYGAKGVLWQVIDGHYSFMDPKDTARDSSSGVLYHFGNNPDFGVHSPLARGPNLDRFAPFHFIESGGYRGYGDTTRATIDTFFTGWNIRSNALTDIHRWIDQVGPSLMKLDWRTGYSMHFTVWQPHDSTISYRPLANEFIDSVHARYPGGAVRDSAHRTFVELGLFYTKNATNDP